MTGQSTSDRRHQTMRLADGRLLGYAEFGDLQAPPLFLFHGTPGSRLDFESFETDSLPRVHIIAPDRPGFGLSDYQPRRRLLDWPDDVRRLADALRIDRFAVAGVSGGGPHALVCVYALPDRVTSAGVISGAVPAEIAQATREMHAGNKLYTRLTQRAPFLLWPLFALVGFICKRWPEWYVGMGIKALPDADKAVFEDEQTRRRLVQNLAEPFRKGARGVMQESRFDAEPWGFDLAQITRPVFQWHGEADRNVPVEQARQLAAMIPTNHLTICPGEGHLLLHRHQADVVEALVGGHAADEGSSIGGE